MSQNQPAQHHQQDDCEDCQKERAQNNQLIQFYERLNKLKSKVSQIKPQIANHFSASKQQKSKFQKISHKINNSPNINNELNNFDSKQMGYQLACALLERQIRMKKQNQRLSRRIKQLKANSQLTHHQGLKKSVIIKKDSEMQSETQSQFNLSSIHSMNDNQKTQSNNSRMKQSKSVFSDSLDNAIENNNRSFWGPYETSPSRSQRNQEQNSRYYYKNEYNNQYPHENIVNKDSTSFASFDETGRSVFNPIQEQNKKKYENLNLWLYQLGNQQQSLNLYNTKNRSKKSSLKKN